MQFEHQCRPHIRRAREKVSERANQLAATRRRINHTKAEMRKVYGLYTAGGVTVERFKEINQPLEERLCQLGDELPRIEGEIPALEVSGLSASGIAQETKGLAALCPTLDLEESTPSNIGPPFTTRSDQSTSRRRFPTPFCELLRTATSGGCRTRWQRWCSVPAVR
jgi:hypothetical protein